ncbi:ATP-binding protein [Campylobacter porcelli]|uniref:ATP-binding protein n=1 Tax=Campylobacter porcelli TaxID=1660073 RepID=A0ABU7M3A5_9BACT|nr:ATP-binding protein [Campylobacter sp. CX2-4855-23]
MSILEYLYQNPPKSREFLERKIKIESPKTLLKGVNGSGKSSLILNHLSKFEKFLYIDLDDVRSFGLEQNLDEFIKANGINAVAIENVKEPPILPNCDNIIVSTDLNSLHIDGLDELEIFGLDYEEFILFYRKNYDAKTLFSHFLNRGNLAFSPFLSEFEIGAFLQKHIKASKGELNAKILANIANYIHQPLNIFKIYKSLKSHMKLSKDKLYQNILDLKDQNIIKTIYNIDENSNLKRVYFSDFALKTALNLHKDPKAIIANMVFCELLKLKKEIKYSNYLDFIIPDMNLGILVLPFLPFELAVLKAKKLGNYCNELGLKRVDIISNSQSQMVKIDKITYNIMPFWQWAVWLH